MSDKVKLVLREDEPADLKVYRITLELDDDGGVVVWAYDRDNSRYIAEIKPNMEIDLPLNNYGFIPGKRGGKQLVTVSDIPTVVEKLARIRFVMEDIKTTFSCDNYIGGKCNQVLDIIDG